jgi:2-oxoglutarate ferredoxin oxidoreductase subunit beta
MSGLPTFAHTDPTSLKREDFETDQEVRWCPGCGDYAILAQVQKVFPTLGIPRENFVFISGIGCSSRFPYYMNTYGMHSIHGRAPGFATGLKASRPELSVWLVTGDGDGLSIGGNHLMHILRRNVDLKILMFNNRIYGLTKGQYSPTSEQGKRTKSTPMGSIDAPVEPAAFALGANATFVARTVDREPKHLVEVLERAAHHKGTAFVEIYQNCNIFNDGAFAPLTERTAKAHTQLLLKHGEPLLFDKGTKGIAFRDFAPVVVDVAAEGLAAVHVHDEHAHPAYAAALAHFHHPELPVPLGVLRQVQAPTYDELLNAQLQASRDKHGPGDLASLLRGAETWTVAPDPATT